MIDFSQLNTESPISSGDPLSVLSSLTNKERLEYDYLRKRDPMREFFALVSLYFCISFRR